VIQNKHVLWTASGSIQWEGNYRDLLGTKAAPSPKYKKFSAHEKEYRILPRKASS
jgi:hypothetical protein